MTIFDTTTTKVLSDLQAWIRARWRRGCRCPACGQSVKLYKRTLNRGMASVLIDIYKVCREQNVEYLHVSEHFLGQKDNAVAREYSKLRFWGLLEEEPGERENGNGTGRWRVTPLGEAFVKGRVLVPRSVLVFNNQLEGVSDERTTVRQALGRAFDYDELMGPFRDEPVLGALHEQGGLFGDVA